MLLFLTKPISVSVAECNINDSAINHNKSKHELTSYCVSHTVEAENE